MNKKNGIYMNKVCKIFYQRQEKYDLENLITKHTHKWGKPQRSLYFTEFVRSESYILNLKKGVNEYYM